MNTGADRIHGKERVAARRSLERDRLHEQQLGPLEFPVLLSGDDSADHTSEEQGGVLD